jgi:hypothetical protein
MDKDYVLPGDFPNGCFPLGQLFATKGVVLDVPAEDCSAAIARHSRGDWGDVCAEDAEANEHALKHGGRLLSSYRDHHGRKLWIITEHDWSVTTVLLPDEN